MNRNIAIAVLCATGLLWSGTRVYGDDLDFHQGRESSQQIDRYLSGKKFKGKTSPLVGHGQSFISSGGLFDVDPALIVAISGIETAFGTRTCSTDNAWNWFWNGPCPKSPFDSFDSGINTVSKFLRRNYINKGYTSISLIQSKYCTAPIKDGVVCPGWISTVTLFRSQILGTAPNVPLPVTPPASEPEPAPSTTNYARWIFVAFAFLLALAIGWLLGRRRPGAIVR